MSSRESWYRFHEHELVDSTSERAFAELAAGRARHGDVHVARAQSAGRGRLGRRWSSPAGEGLYMSVVLLPPPPAPRPAPLTMSVALAVRAALLALGAPRIEIDWPNDLVVSGAKLAGILVESRGFDAARPHFVVGLGINVRQREFAPELAAERAVTSLALLGCELEVRAVARAILERMPEFLGAPARDLARLYLEATRLAGARVRITSARERLVGEILALDAQRGFDLRLDDGRELSLALETITAVERLDG